MKGLMDLLTEYNIAIIGLCTILMVVLTSVYVYLTGRILKSTNCPEIVVYLCPSETHFYCLNLCVENVGTGLARDIKFTGNLSFAPDHDLPLEKIGFIKKGIDYLGPGQKIEHFLVSVIGREDLFKEQPKRISITYGGSGKSKENRDFYLDFSQLENLANLGEPPLVKVANATEGIEENLRAFMDRRKRPIVLTESPSENHASDCVKVLRVWLADFPVNVQNELLTEFENLIKKKKQEIPKEDRVGSLKERMSRFP